MAIKMKLDQSKLVRNLAAKNVLVPHLDRAISEGDFDWTYQYEPKRIDDGWHPSGDCTPTPYELYQKAQIDPWSEERVEDFSVGLWKTFQVGHFWHQFLQHIVEHKLGFCERTSIERRGLVAWDEQGKLQREIYPMNPTPKTVVHTKAFHYLTGSADIAPCTIPEHGDFLVDFKTMKSMDFRKNDAPDWCVNKWEAQLNIYMDFFDLERGIIVGINKDSPHDFKEFEFHRNDDLIATIYEKLMLVSECLDEEVPPPKDFDLELPLEGPIKR